MNETQKLLNLQEIACKNYRDQLKTGNVELIALERGVTIGLSMALEVLGVPGAFDRGNALRNLNEN